MCRISGALLAAWAVVAAEVDLGAVRVSVSDSFTAQVFHIVDQLSEWDEACHRQYGRWAARALELDDRDRALLRQHASLRKVRGWGGGFDQAFYTIESIETAARQAIEKGLLTAVEANAEVSILQHFTPKLVPLRDHSAGMLASFTVRLNAEADRLRPFVRRVAGFAESHARHGSAVPGAES